MSTPDQSKGDRSRDEVLAGEYVLGVLGVAERAEVEARLRHDRPFAEVVRRWEANLLQFNDDYAEVSPPDPLFGKIEQRLFPVAVNTAAPRGLWNALWLWRGLSFASLGGLALVAGLQWAPQLRPQPAATRLTAELSGEQSQIALLASYDAGSGQVEGEQAPISLGVLPQTGQGEIAVPEDLRGRLAEGVVLAVSLEPFGGSPTGKATGPVLALGPIHP
jgi:anti-sigma-K factor RskA